MIDDDNDPPIPPNETGAPDGAPQPSPQPSSVSTDLSAGTLSLASEFDINDALIENRARRKMRWIAFFVLGGICAIYLLCLAISLKSLLSSEVMAVFASTKDWHLLSLVGLSLVIFAAIPLSLSLALVRMISGAPETRKEEEISFTTPQLELFKVIIDAAKAFKG